MLWTPRNWLTLAAISGFVSIAMGAFAAHAVADPHAKDLLRTGAQYEFMHAIATIVCASLVQLGAERARFAPACFLAGSLFFSGSLYALAFGAPQWTGAITPVGGLMFLAGWAVLIWAARGIDHGSNRSATEKV